MNRRSRAGRSSFGNFILLLVVVAAVGIGILYGQKWWDYQKMKEVSRISLNDWQVYDDKAVAERRFERELEGKQIPWYIPDNACKFSVNDYRQRQLYCWWETAMTVPLVDYSYPLEFEITTIINDRGRVEQW